MNVYGRYIYVCYRYRMAHTSQIILFFVSIFNLYFASPAPYRLLGLESFASTRSCSTSSSSKLGYVKTSGRRHYPSFTLPTCEPF